MSRTLRVNASKSKRESTIESAESIESSRRRPARRPRRDSAGKLLSANKAK
ncbi:MAG: hypothetical protein LBN22_00265 [Clostridiales Family XIII bacterium]|jgi:hypothetical protein|nr:hypothetical protein [Clostridiales Family XIII bacterium]